MLVFENTELFCAKGKFCHSVLLHCMLPYLKTDMESYTEKFPIVAKAVLMAEIQINRKCGNISSYLPWVTLNLIKGCLYWFSYSMFLIKKARRAKSSLLFLNAASLLMYMRRPGGDSIKRIFSWVFRSSARF